MFIRLYIILKTLIIQLQNGLHIAQWFLYSKMMFSTPKIFLPFISRTICYQFNCLLFDVVQLYKIITKLLITIHNSIINRLFKISS